ncbi:MAG: N-acetyltransferase family protein [Acidobacteriota bacterium]
MAADTPILRRAVAGDAVLLSALGERTFRDTFAADNDPADLQEYLAASFSPAKQAAELADPASTFLIAEAASTAIGYAQLRSGDAPACVRGARPTELVRIYVDRPWLGRGVGELLLTSAIGEARSAGFLTLWLGVWERNHRALAFYRRHGFTVVGSHIFQLGSDPQTDLLMERAL